MNEFPCEIDRNNDDSVAITGARHGCGNGCTLEGQETWGKLLEPDWSPRRGPETGPRAAKKDKRLPRFGRERGG